MHHVNLPQSCIIPEHYTYMQVSAGADQCDGARTAENVIISDSSLESPPCDRRVSCWPSLSAQFTIMPAHSWPMTAVCV